MGPNARTPRPAFTTGQEIKSDSQLGWMPFGKGVAISMRLAEAASFRSLIDPLRVAYDRISDQPPAPARHIAPRGPGIPGSGAGHVSPVRWEVHRPGQRAASARRPMGRIGNRPLLSGHD